MNVAAVGLILACDDLRDPRGGLALAGALAVFVRHGPADRSVAFDAMAMGEAAFAAYIGTNKLEVSYSPVPGRRRDYRSRRPRAARLRTMLRALARESPP